MRILRNSRSLERQAILRTRGVNLKLVVPDNPSENLRVAIIRDRVSELSSGLPGTVDSLIRRVSTITGIEPTVIRGESRTAEACWCRWAIMLVAREGGRTFEGIGRQLDGRDHTTVLHGCRRAKILERDDIAFGFLVEILREHQETLRRMKLTYGEAGEEEQE